MQGQIKFTALTLRFIQFTPLYLLFVEFETKFQLIMFLLTYMRFISLSHTLREILILKKQKHEHIRSF